MKTKTMVNEYNLQRFIDAQKRDYDIAFSELKNGRKRSHWMWYIFPQVKGLGFSEMSQHYGIQNLEEAEAFIQHPVLGERLINICKELLQLQSSNAGSVFGSPDDMKLKSSMTLFALLPGANPVFQAVLDKFFGGKKDNATMKILGK